MRWKEGDWKEKRRGAEDEMSLESLPPGYPGKFFVAACFPLISQLNRRPETLTVKPK
jgi:hypothetical protein